MDPQVEKVGSFVPVSYFQDRRQ